MTKYSLLSALIALFLVSCQHVQVEPYQGKDYVQFKVNNTFPYSFVFAGSSVQKDTIWLDALCIGTQSSAPRSFKVIQVPEYTFTYRYDETGNIKDSVLVEVGNQAEPGVHYIDFDDPEYDELFKLAPDSITFKVPVIVLRDPSLKYEDKTLMLRFVPSDDFLTGDQYTIEKKIVISDQLFYPPAWSDYFFQPGIKGTNPIFGNYGKVKHQLLIDVTGKPWDNEFIDSMTFEDELYYKNLAAKELARINKVRAENGEPPLMEDPNNPNSVVVFP